MNFSCPRTCPAAREKHCRFSPILDALGPVRVDSHTVRVQVEYRDAEVLRAAVAKIGGRWIGQETHHFYNNETIINPPVNGLGFMLPGWTYPCVLTESSELVNDNMNGAWGDPVELEKLHGQYTLILAEQQAEAQGWSHERTGDGLMIYCPAGGQLHVSPAGVVDATGFVGTGCHDSIQALDLGKWLEAQAKPEFGAVAAAVQVQVR
jgi:hypothetical protein